MLCSRCPTDMATQGCHVLRASGDYTGPMQVRCPLFFMNISCHDYHVRDGANSCPEYLGPTQKSRPTVAPNISDLRQLRVAPPAGHAIMSRDGDIWGNRLPPSLT